jgi:hypothetical protein
LNRHTTTARGKRHISLLDVRGTSALTTNEYGDSLDQVLYGWVGDVRVVSRALPVKSFIMA